jgi:hypothetical protein
MNVVASRTMMTRTIVAIAGAGSSRSRRYDDDNGLGHGHGDLCGDSEGHSEAGDTSVRG